MNHYKLKLAFYKMKCTTGIFPLSFNDKYVLYWRKIIIYCLIIPAFLNIIYFSINLICNKFLNKDNKYLT